MIGLIERLCAARGVSGDEGAVRALIRSELEGVCTLTEDALGNLIAKKRGRERPKNKVVLFAHMDEVGLMITRVTDEGLLKFSSIGMDPRVLHGRRVLIGENALPGVIGSKVLHHLTESERKQPLTADSLYLDIGAKDRADAQAHVSLGDTAALEEPFLLFGDGYVSARALDDRVGCAVLVSLLKSELAFDLTGVFTVGEESSMAGATAAAFHTAPDIALILETTTAGDVCGAPEDKRVCSLGSGPVVSFADKGSLYDRELYRLAFSTAGRHGILVQTKEGVFGANEGRVVGRAGEGARILAVSTPCRYLHSASCVMKRSDAEAVRELTGALLPVLASL